MKIYSVIPKIKSEIHDIDILFSFNRFKAVSHIFIFLKLAGLTSFLYDIRILFHFFFV